MINIPCLTWQAYPAVAGPVAQYSADMAVDENYLYQIQGLYQDKNYQARYVTIDNIAGDQTIRGYFDNVRYGVGRFERRTLVIPLGAQRFGLEYVSGTKSPVTLVFAYDNLGYGDATDQYAVGSATGGGSGVKFRSTPQIITAGGSLVIPHGLGDIPAYSQASLVCVTAENGFAVGREILVPTANFGTGFGLSPALALDFNAAEYFVRFGASDPTFRYLDKSSGASVNLTNASWKLILQGGV